MFKSFEFLSKSLSPLGRPSRDDRRGTTASSLSKSPAKAKRRLGFEGLEQRQMLTGSVTATIDANSNLVLTGGDEDNHVIVSRGTIANQVIIRGGRSVATDSSSGTLMNGLDTPAIYDNVVGGIIFDLGLGNDRLVVTNYTSRGAITGHLGDGNDQFAMESNSAGPVKFTLNNGTAPIFAKVNTNSLVSVDGDAGSDRLALYDALIGGSLTFNGGGSGDRFTSTGTSTTSNKVSGSVQLTPGPGDDTATIFRMAVSGSFRMDDGSAVNSATANFTNLQVNGDILMNMSIKRDYVTLAGENTSTGRFKGKSVTINTGDGNDRVTIDSGVVSSALTLATGNGAEIGDNNTAGVRLSNLTIGSDLVVDSGSDNDNVLLDTITAKNVNLTTQDGDDVVNASRMTVTFSGNYETFNGNDTVILRSSKYSKVTVKLDDQDDTLRVGSVTVTQSAFFNGSTGTNTFVDEGGNVFAILTKLNFKK